jgi:hypothetical protein
MAKIALSKGGFSLIPEGKRIFKIIGSKYEEDFGKLEIELVTAAGQKHTERFSLIDKNGEINEKAQGAFSYFAKTALNNFNLEEIDHEDIVGCYIECEVIHEKLPSTKDPAKTVTFVKLGDKSPASGFEEEEEKKSPAPKDDKSAAPKKNNSKVNLDDLLG